MGNPASKVGEEIEEEKTVQGSLPSTPILTPKRRTFEDLDPRSPSANIIRTPIQQLVLSADSKTPMEEAITEVDKCDTFNINSPAPKIADFDPRSPTTEFTRTPIVLPASPNKLPTKLYNKNFDNVRKTLINVTPKKISDMSSHVPPRLLESNILVPKPENKRKSFVGVLETNLDYIETDLDEVIRGKAASEPELRFSPSTQQLKSKFLESHNRIDVLESEDVDPRSPTLDFTRTPLQITKKIGEIDLNPENDGANVVVDDDGLISTIQQKEEEKTPPKVIEITPKIIEKKSRMNTVNDFDKKISSLIYTDEDAVMVSKSITGASKGGNRTPLGIRNGQPKRPVPKLKVSDKPRRSDYSVSKIPVFKDKKSARETENIPPKSTIEPRSKMTKRAQWDSNNTLIL